MAFVDNESAGTPGPEIFESDPAQIEESFFSFSRNYSMIIDRKRDEDFIEETVDAADAFAVFANKQLDTSNHNFDGQVPSTSRAANFRAKPSYNEAPAARYKRITQELKDLQNEFTSMDKVEKKAGASTMASGVGKLLEDMQKIKENEKYKPSLKIDYALGVEFAKTKGACAVLRDEVNRIEAPDAGAGAEPVMKGVTYEFYGTSGKKSDRTAEIVILDKRLGVLEATIGTSRLEMMPDIRTSVDFLSRKMDVLDKDKMKTAEKKMNGLSREMKNLEKDKNKLAGAKKSDYQMKIAELYGMMGRWDQCSQQLPIVAARLQSIKDMTDVGGSSQGQLKSAVIDKDTASKLIKENSALLLTTREKFKATVTEMKTMCDLEKGIKDMENKMKKVR